MVQKDQNPIDPEKIHLAQIESLEVSISDLDEPFMINESIEMKVGHISAHNIEDKRFMLGLDVILRLNARQPEKLARFLYKFHFTIDNLEQMYNLKEDGTPLFNKQFVATLAGISYSTLRGIIFEKLLNSSWGSVTVPVVNPHKILENWIELKK